jgi:hypothetical protein
MIMDVRLVWLSAGPGRTSAHREADEAIPRYCLATGETRALIEILGAQRTH